MDYLITHNTVRERDQALLYKHFGDYKYRCLSSDIQGTQAGRHTLTKWEAIIEYNSVPHALRIEITDSQYVKSTLWREHRTQ